MAKRSIIFSAIMVVLHLSHLPPQTSTPLLRRPSKFFPTIVTKNECFVIFLFDIGLYAKVNSRLEVIEEGLARARAAIKEATRSQNYTSHEKRSFIPRGVVCKNPDAFYQSHIEMQKRFKIWTYKEGEPPLFRHGPLNDIYSIEGQMITELNGGGGTNTHFLARHPDEAHAFFIPVSIVAIIRYVYRPYTNYSRKRLQNIMADYVRVVSERLQMYQQPTRTYSNPSSEGFHSSCNVSLPEIFLPFGKLGTPIINQTPGARRIIAFVAGGPHGKDKDESVQVHGYLPRGQNYTVLTGQSKFCLCPSGWEVASPRLVESIYNRCILVIIADNYTLPFSDVLDWSKFSVHIPVGKFPEIKSILEGISMRRYVILQKKSRES
ncbi:hypothetical protein Cgig2_029136 [Carnegiea gigantea]|uniref:Exostosin GT47 domain-containing protein n=1 Tax=Carnegiea gigantea TaxID=171969 RepID=A0A9Q1QJW3_9CARY|nr:hypothetical protein Cgig2_029136 [Carnegiea gigantea]